MNDNKDFGCSLEFFNNYGLTHEASRTELIYLLEGNARITVSDNSYRMKKDDLILVNYGQNYSWQQEKDTFICVIGISNKTIREEGGALNVSFRCNSAAAQDADYKEIKKIISDLIVEYTEDYYKLTFRKKAIFFSLLDVLFNRYISEGSIISDVLSTDEQFIKIVEYINENYNKHLLLSNVAGEIFMSDSAFSRYFKKHAGVNYSEYLTNVRLHKAAMQLLQTENTLTQIALDNGFADLAMFSKSFKKYYMVSPSEYKRTQTDKKQGRMPEQSGINEIREYHSRLVRFVDERKNKNVSGILKKHVSVNTSVFEKYNKIWNIAINIGEASDLLMADMQKNVIKLKKDLGFGYVRIVNIFGWNMHIRQDRQHRRLSFDLLDNVIDFMLDNEIRPILEFGDKPRRLTLDIDRIIPLENGRPVFESAVEARWLIEEFIEHIEKRYGRDETEKWIFEFWYDKRDRNLSEDDYLDMFDMAYHAVKSHMPGAQLGGCGLELGADVSALLGKWHNSHERPDFISAAAFPYISQIDELNYANENKIRSTDIHFMYNELQKLKASLTAAGMNNVPVMLTEWNLCMSDRNFYNDSCAKAAQMLMNMTECINEMQLGAYLFGTDLNSRYYDTSADFYGGAGLLTKNMLTKPSFYAVQFMGRLGNVLLQHGDGYIVTRTEKGEFIILMFNYKKFNYNYYTRRENEIRAEDLHRLFSDDDPIKIELELSGISNGQYQVKTENLGINSGGFISAWTDLGESSVLDKSEIEYLKRISVPKIRIRRQNAQGGRLVVSEILEAHDIRFIKIKKL